MAQSHKSYDFSRDVQQEDGSHISSSGRVYAPACTNSQVECEFESDLQLARSRPASFAGSDLANALGNQAFYARDAHNWSNTHVQQTALEQTTPAHRSSTQRDLDYVIPQGVVFSAGHDYQEQWKAEHQPQPVASSSKAPRVLATNPKARATEYIDHLEQTLESKVEDLQRKADRIEWLERALEDGNIAQEGLETALDQRCSENNYLRSLLLGHGNNL
ncbi:hypothetical protein DENSPDRAFT_892557 [Dentipellis sp. KUC8613]|nr:hypothetical protein DENSPDRAFT_892557 [Dentipellis sp. KUC8613]